MITRIEKLVYGGSGMGEVSGRRMFVPYSAPGDLIDVEIVREHVGFANAAIVSTIEPSPCRVEPRCPVFGLCGGCQWQHISYGAQLEWKHRILVETLKRIGKIPDPNVLETLPSPKEWHYRNRIQLHVDSKGRIGFYKAESKEIVEFAECAIADEKLNIELNLRRKEIARRDRGIALRLDDREGSFAQINPGQNDNLKHAIVEWLRGIPHGTILELYAGSGNLTFTVAPLAAHVVASDVDARAIVVAKERQLREGIDNVKFVCAAGADAACRFVGSCDVVLVDPPRKGCVDAIDRIAMLAPQSILYVSCNPATLARDAASLVGRGYRLIKSLPIDMFPQTFHIESLTLLTLA